MAATVFAKEKGLSAYRSDEFVTGDAIDVGERLARVVIDGKPGIYVWGGETTVELPERPGRGGRNQTLALAAAKQIAGEKNLFFLAAGTDGTDGPTDDAGAVVDGATIRRATRQGLNADACLANANAGTFLDASGNLIRTGPTGANVMDLMLALKVA